MPHNHLPSRKKYFVPVWSAIESFWWYREDGDREREEEKKWDTNPIFFSRFFPTIFSKWKTMWKPQRYVGLSMAKFWKCKCFLWFENFNCLNERWLFDVCCQKTKLAHLDIDTYCGEFIYIRLPSIWFYGFEMFAKMCYGIKSYVP